MKDFMRLAIDALKLILEFAMEQLNIVKYATTKNPWLAKSKGKMAGFVMVNRMGRQEMRRLPMKFIIKKPKDWEGRENYFKNYLRLTKILNFNLALLYEKKPDRKNFYNVLSSQISKFWIGGPTPKPYAFIPGARDVIIGNGSLPDARNVRFTASAGGHLLIKWNPKSAKANEYRDDVLQVMLITGDGSFGVWHPICGDPAKPKLRKDGTAGFDWVVPAVFTKAVPCEAYCAIKFQSGKKLKGKLKGNFRFPEGVMPITLIP